MNMSLKKILPLKKRDLVEIVSPASGCTSERIKNGVAALMEWGLSTRVWMINENAHPFHSDEDEYRLFSLVESLKRPESKLVWAQRGGYGAQRLIPSLLKIKKPIKPKVFIGFSDMTILHLFFNQQWGWKTIHAPMLSVFSFEEFAKKDLEELKKLLFKSDKFAFKTKLSALNKAALVTADKKIQGELLGGNLSVFVQAVGTKIHPRTKGKILFFEDIGERGYRLDRMLNHLEQAGVFDHVKAVIFGEFSDGEEKSGDDLTSFSLVRFAENKKFPVYELLEFGHGERNRPMIVGGKYEIFKKQFKLVEF